MDKWTLVSSWNGTNWVEVKLGMATFLDLEENTNLECTRSRNIGGNRAWRKLERSQNIFNTNGRFSLFEGVTFWGGNVVENGNVVHFLC